MFANGKKPEFHVNGTSEINDTDINPEEDDIMNDIPNSFRKLKDDHFPLIITYEKFIKMLQGSYGIDPNNPTKLPPNLGVNENDDYGDGDGDDGDGDSDDNGGDQKLSYVTDYRHFVNYNLFENKYWPHFGDYYRRNFDCGLVFSELSIIKVCSR